MKTYTIELSASELGAINGCLAASIQLPALSGEPSLALQDLLLKLQPAKLAERLAQTGGASPSDEVLWLESPNREPQPACSHENVRYSTTWQEYYCPDCRAQFGPEAPTKLGL